MYCHRGCSSKLDSWPRKSTKETDRTFIKTITTPRSQRSINTPRISGLKNHFIGTFKPRNCRFTWNKYRNGKRTRAKYSTKTTSQRPHSGCGLGRSAGFRQLLNETYSQKLTCKIGKCRPFTFLQCNVRKY